MLFLSYILPYTQEGSVKEKDMYPLCVGRSKDCVKRASASTRKIWEASAVNQTM